MEQKILHVGKVSGEGGIYPFLVEGGGSMQIKKYLKNSEGISKGE